MIIRTDLNEIITKKVLDFYIAEGGDLYLEMIFGSKAQNALSQLGGVWNVAKALEGLLFD